MRSVGYDASISVLEIEFWDGDVYRYGNVPFSVYVELMLAESLGCYFNANLGSNRAYTCRQLR